MIKYKAKIDLTYFLDIESSNENLAFEELKQFFKVNNNFNLQRKEVEFFAAEEVKEKEIIIPEEKKSEEVEIVSQNP